MTIGVIGTGIGRTGTYSLKLAINELGIGPCHHMEEVLHNMPVQVPMWSAALGGSPDWQAIYSGYRSAVDWPTACFFRELLEAYPTARFVLTHRDPERWADSFGATIYKLVAGRDQAPPAMKEWIEMAAGVIARTGFPDGLDHDGLIKAFSAHNEAVKNTIPADQLLVYELKDGWGAALRIPRQARSLQPFPAHQRPRGILGARYGEDLTLELGQCPVWRDKRDKWRRRILNACNGPLGPSMRRWQDRSQPAGSRPLRTMPQGMWR